MLEHGGNLALAAAQYGIPLENWLDLSTGINPNGYPIPNIPHSAWQRLPIENDGLIEAALAYYGCQHAIAAAGSQAALQVLPQLRAHSKIAMPQLMYQEHGKAWQRYGHEVIRFEAYPDTHIINNADVLLLCNPNNPTATLFSITELLNLHAQLASRGGWLIVDEAFIDVTPEHSIAQYAHLDGLFVLRSIGKFFGLAGARVGFLIGAEQALIKAQEEIGPWSITGPSRIVAKQALTDKAWQQQTRAQLPAISQKLASMLAQYGLTPTAGTALFQFVYTAQAKVWQQHFAQQGILVRLFSDCSALRFGLPTEDGWLKLEKALESFK
ncbi:threonine-phosphate decarboxylase [mine drainage metagenome]|uniref:threonine-phosphate decarboxylase n=1 Tax=mine drainage metagenome TaxID=410659 RepID=A0A1J5TAD7_9ZZZZ